MYNPSGLPPSVSSPFPLSLPPTLPNIPPSSSLSSSTTPFSLSMFPSSMSSSSSASSSSSSTSNFSSPLLPSQATSVPSATTSSSRVFDLPFPTPSSNLNLPSSLPPSPSSATSLFSYFPSSSSSSYITSANSSPPFGRIENYLETFRHNSNTLERTNGTPLAPFSPFSSFSFTPPNPTNAAPPFSHLPLPTTSSPFPSSSTSPSTPTHPSPSNISQSLYPPPSSTPLSVPLPSTPLPVPYINSPPSASIPLPGTPIHIHSSSSPPSPPPFSSSTSPSSLSSSGSFSSSSSSSASSSASSSPPSTFHVPLPPTTRISRSSMVSPSLPITSPSYSSSKKRKHSIPSSTSSPSTSTSSTSSSSTPSSAGKSRVPVQPTQHSVLPLPNVIELRYKQLVGLCPMELMDAVSSSFDNDPGARGIMLSCSQFVISSEHIPLSYTWHGMGPVHICKSCGFAALEKFFVKEHNKVMAEPQRCLEVFNEEKQSWSLDLDYSPHGIEIYPDGNLLICSYAQHKVKLHSSLDGRVMRSFNVGGPESIAIDRSTGLIVVSCGDHKLRVYQPNGTQIRHFGGLGSELGELHFPYGVCVDRRGHVYVADSWNKRIQVFSIEGKLLRSLDRNSEHSSATITSSKSNGMKSSKSTPNSLGECWGVVIDSRDRMMVADTSNNRVQTFGALDLKPLKVQFPKEDYPGTSEKGGGRGFHTPTDVVVDGQDNIYVTCYYDRRVHVFDQNGSFLHFLEPPSSTDKTTKASGEGTKDDSSVAEEEAEEAEAGFPSFMAIDQSRGILYVSESARNRVNCYRIGV